MSKPSCPLTCKNNLLISESMCTPQANRLYFVRSLPCFLLVSCSPRRQYVSLCSSMCASEAENSRQQHREKPRHSKNKRIYVNLSNMQGKDRKQAHMTKSGGHRKFVPQSPLRHRADRGQIPDLPSSQDKLNPRKNFVYRMPMSNHTSTLCGADLQAWNRKCRHGHQFRRP